MLERYFVSFCRIIIIILQYFWLTSGAVRVARFSQQNVLLKTSPIAFRGGFPGKVRIPGAKYHVIGVASTRGHEKQPAATVLK